MFFDKSSFSSLAGVDRGLWGQLHARECFRPLVAALPPLPEGQAPRRQIWRRLLLGAMELSLEGHRFEDLSQQPSEADAEIQRDALQHVRGLSGPKAEEIRDYLQREGYVDLGCLLEARNDPGAWAEIRLPLHVKQSLARQLQKLHSDEIRIPGTLGMLLGSIFAAVGSFLGPSRTARLMQCSAGMQRLIRGSDFSELWHWRRRYVQIATTKLAGMWLDNGVNEMENADFRFLTAMRELPRHGPVDRRFEAITHFSELEAKVSYSILTGAIFLCYERFMDPCTGIISGPVNMASGILDLRQEQPRIFGNWLQYYGRIDLGKGPQAMRRCIGQSWSPSKPQALGSFNFVRINMDNLDMADVEPSRKRQRVFDATSVGGHD
eukprot:symbB.v1.2.017746.t1/scaffold1390.1/size121990/3